MPSFLCGPGPAGKADKKAVRNFSQFLQGVGRRCTLCLHKADKHGMGGCEAKSCNCADDNLQVLSRRRWAPAPGWKDDE